MATSTTTSRFLVLLVCLAYLGGCRTRDESDSRSSAASATDGGAVDQPPEATSTPPANPGALSLVARAVTAENRCSTGGVACVGNGVNLGCSDDGRLGMCAYTRTSPNTTNGLGCDCKTAPIPPDVAIETCNATSKDTVCNSRAYGSSCVRDAKAVAPGFCVPNNSTTGSCDCSNFAPQQVAADAVVDQPEGEACSNYGSRTAASCLGLAVGDACTIANSITLGACITSDADSNCACVASALRPNLPDRVCDNSASRDGCEAMRVGTACFDPRAGAEGVCTNNGKAAGYNTECSCASSSYSYPQGPRVSCGTSTENSVACRNSAIGAQCAEDGLAGTCLITAGANGDATCMCATSAKLKPKQVATPTGISIVTTAEAPGGLLNVRIGWNPDPDDLAKGYKILVGSAKGTCDQATDIGKVTSYVAGNQSPNTAYFVTLCAYSATGTAAAPAFGEYLTSSLPSAAVCGSVHTNVQYTGSAYEIRGTTVNVPSLVWYDQNISSVKLSPDCRMQLFSEPNFGGTSYSAVASIEDLRTVNFNDLARSLKCTCAPGTTLLVDNFNRADSSNLGPNWSEFFGDLAIGGNQLKGNAAGWCGAASTASAADVVVEADFSSTPAATGEFGVVLRYAGPADMNMYNAQYDISRSYLRLFKNVNGAWTFIGEGSAPGVTSGRIKFTAIGNVLTVYVNGAQILTTVDSSLTAAGRTGFRIDGTAVRIDNFSVSKP